ncbi:hypothetical protein CHUAL_008271 [Chamberlinius hualienensis]
MANDDKENRGPSELVPAILTLLILYIYIILLKYRTTRKYMNAYVEPIFQAIFGKPFHANFQPARKLLFRGLATITSQDEILRAKNQIRILEIGPGPGFNFQFYPNCRLVMVQPESAHTFDRDENLSKNPQVKVEKVFIYIKEDLSFIDTDSIDVVVATFVLCRLQNIDKILEEISRILVPNGKYYFMEHCSNIRPTWNASFETLPYSLMKHGVKHAARNSLKNIAYGGFFSNVRWATVDYPSNIRRVVRASNGCVYSGVAVK